MEKSIEDKGRALQARWAKQDAQSWERGLSLTLETPVGRRMIWLFLGECGIFQNHFNPDPATMSFNLGMQNVGQKLLARIVTDHSEQYLQMQRENYNVDSERNDRSAEFRLANLRDGYSYGPDSGTNYGDN